MIKGADQAEKLTNYKSKWEHDNVDEVLHGAPHEINKWCADLGMMQLAKDEADQISS